MTTKLVENVDEDTWNKFAGYCKMKDKLIGYELSKILLEHLNKEGIK